VFHRRCKKRFQPLFQAYKQKLYGPKYVWFIIGWYADNWYMHDTNCTVEQMQEVLAGHFTTEGVMLNQDRRASISGMVSSDCHGIVGCNQWSIRGAKG